MGHLCKTFCHCSDVANVMSALMIYSLNTVHRACIEFMLVHYHD